MTVSEGRGRSRTAAHVFQGVAGRAAEAPALRQGYDQLSYAEVAGAAGRVADRLRAEGVGAGDVVATVMDRSHRCMIAVLGAWAVGAAYVHLEPTDPDSRIAKMLVATCARAVLTDRRNFARLPADTPAAWILDEDVSPGPYWIAPERSPDDVAYLVCTSGSTGTPKSVAVRHGELLNYCDAFWQRVDAGELRSFGLATTFAADLGKVSVYGALLSGARLDVYTRETTLDPVALATDLRDHPVDCLTYTPSQLAALGGAGDLAALLPQRVLVVAGEAFPPWLAGAILDRRPDLEVHNGYGPSEATILATMHRVRPEDGKLARVPVGTPLNGVDARVLNEERRPVDDGVPGVLHLGGACVALGYVGEPVLTAEKFVVLDEPGARFYCTDDLVVRLADGSLDFLGRADRQLKVRGNRVEPGEVEAALMTMPGVRQAVVTGERTKPGSPLELVGYVRGTATPAELIRSLREHLPSAMVPNRISVVPEIPVNLNGKIDFAALRAASDVEVTADEPADPPRTPNERLVTDIWSTVLGGGRIGRHERFLEIGGDSFKALTVFARLRRHHPGLVIAQLYAHATVSELAAALDGPGEAAPADKRVAKVIEL